MADDAKPDLSSLLHPIAATEPAMLSDVSAWAEHIPFAFALTMWAKPRLYVELGAHKGDSYCAVCQAVKSLGLGARCAAVDTWEGDEHAGRYGADVLRTLRAHHDPLYGSFSRLMQMTFDAAVGQFADRSIDVLHIDGLHTYEAVRHDFETWLPKIGDRGVVLFHDTRERGGDFGVWRFWEEVSRGRPSFEFEHGHGLGVLAVGPDAPAEVLALCGLDGEEAAAARRYYAALGARLETRRVMSSIMGAVFAQQMMLNEWRARIGQLVPAKAADPRAAMADPVGFLGGQARDVEALALDDLRLRQRAGMYPPGPLTLSSGTAAATRRK